MANSRSPSSWLHDAWLLLVLGAGIYGGSVLFGLAPLPAEEQVVEVRIVGNKAVPERKIRSRIRTRTGRPLRMETLEEDVRSLNRTHLFIDVKTYSQQVPGGRIVVFEVFERPTLTDVRYIGNKKIKTKTLQKEVNLKVGEALDPFEVKEARAKLEELYRSKGFSNARVTVAEGNEPGDRRAVFTINEGRKQRVLWTQFVGNTIASDARLRTQIRSKPGILWFFNGEVDHKQIEEDVNRLTAYYRGLGFFRARVGRELDFNEARDWLTLTFVIDEGPRYKVRNVSFLGNKKFASGELAEGLTLTDGQHFDQSKMTGDVAKIQDQYGCVGHIFADVKAEPRFLEEPGTLDLVYNIREGARYRVGRINVRIKGDDPHTKITTVLNRLGDLRPGDIVDIRKIRSAERRLRASGLFLTDPSKGAAPKIVFSPPELEEEETQIARPPKSARPKIRGQSPDAIPCGGWEMRPSSNTWPDQRSVDLTLPCRWTRSGAPPRAAAGSERGAFARPDPNHARPGPLVVRGQYTAEPGWATPQLGPQMPRPGRSGPSTSSSFSRRTITSSAPPFRPSPPAGASPPPATTAAAPAPGYGNAASPPPRQPITGTAVAPTPLLPGRGIFSEDSPFFGGQPQGDPFLPIYVSADETQTGRLMFGVGINSDAGLVGSIVVDERNFDWRRIPTSWEDVRSARAFRGAGQHFRLEAVPGTIVQRYMVSFQEPYLFDTRVSLGTSLFFYDRLYREWDEQRLGGRVSLGYQFTPDLSGSFSYRGAKINVNDPIVTGVPELDEVVGDNSLHGFGFRLAHDTRDSAFLATQGHLIEMSVEQVLGSFQYARADVDVRQYFLLHQRPDGSGRHVLSLSGRVGVSGADTPIYEHYYAGGFSTIRGFDFREASPRDPRFGVLTGGEFQLLASAQYLFPITADDMLRAVAFCDTGTVEPTINNWTDRYRVSVGFGLRITVAAMGPAPIALDFAFPISSEPGDRKEVFSFFVGFNQ